MLDKYCDNCIKVEIYKMEYSFRDVREKEPQVRQILKGWTLVQFILEMFYKVCCKYIRGFANLEELKVEE